MNNNVFYGTTKNESLTYLEFGEINIKNSEKKVWNFQLHQKAYDWLMLGRYSNDLLNILKMNQCINKGEIQDAINIYNKEIHHKDEASLNLAKYIALEVTNQFHEKYEPKFYELGQTIFGCIEGIELTANLLKKLGIIQEKVDLENCIWYGVDISELFNEMSVLLHSKYNVNTMLTPDSLPEKMDVFFAKGISLLYVVRNYDDLFNTIGKGRISIFDYSFSLGDIEDTTIGSGKTVRYLSMSDFMNRFNNQKEVLFVKKSNSKYIPETNRIWLDCVYGDELLCEKYIEQDTRMRKELFDRLSHINESGRFLNNDMSPIWLPVNEYINLIR